LAELFPKKVIKKKICFWNENVAREQKENINIWSIKSVNLIWGCHKSEGARGGKKKVKKLMLRFETPMCDFQLHLSIAPMYNPET
jgi:hypothetical protein